MELMLNFFKLCISSCFLFFSGCYLPKKNCISLEIRNSTDSFAIPAPLHNVSWNQIFTDSTSLLIAIDNEKRNILTYDLLTKQLYKLLSINYPDERYGTIMQVTANDKIDSIFIVTTNYILIVNGNDASTLDSFPTFPKYIVNDTSEMLYGDSQNKLTLYYDGKGNLYMRQKPYSDLKNKDIFYLNREVYFNFKNKTFTKVNYSFPAIYRKKYIGDFKNSYRVFAGDSKIISFDGDPVVYLLAPNMPRRELRLSSSYDTLNEVSALDTTKYDVWSRKSHLMANPFYSRIIFDPYRNLYYRLFMGKSDGDNFVDKPAVLMIMDKEMNLIKEIKLSGKNDWYTSFVSPKGLYIAKDFHDLNERFHSTITLQYHVLQYEVYEINCK